ncbi:hypothetical protein L2E82_17333 [Cichorium intybus]|uniref:Uncharacterized protein n=1 Tax=Cichorium intybus TaxID=13427 RepID=A0ACB9F7F8_CICIN|nr:hypothetical protein L2E82_17333 [Cichorium intybus]
MPGLMRLDLSDNHFSGSIPVFISEFKALIDLRLGGNSLGGRIPSSIIDLGMLCTLNISNNGVTGEIPSGLRKMVMLQQLDVSHNHLAGNLASVAELRGLTDLNISYNLFTGSIPAALVKFLNASFYSFLGNPSLCVDCGLNCDAGRNFRRCAHLNHIGLTKFETAMVVLGSSVPFFAVVGLGRMFQYRQRQKSDIEDGDILFNRVMEATEDLNDKYIIGQGAHGTVYKAFLGNNDDVYAVKKLMFEYSEEARAGMVREIKTVGKVRHRNLVKLEDILIKTNYGLILYRYMQNGSLHDILHEAYPPPLLDWSMRCNIALGTAYGLEYLHFDCHPAITYMNMKNTSFVITAEYAFTCTKSMESDVYSYGVVLLELLTRKKAVDPSFADGLHIVRWVRSVWNEKVEIGLVVDEGVYNNRYDSFVREQVIEVLRLALRCTDSEASKRPSMRVVVKELEQVYAALRIKLN